MHFLYNTLVYIVGFFLRIAALFNEKLRLFVQGRKEVFKYLNENIADGDRIIWFHTASLGEFEQGLPVIEQTKKDFPQHKLLVTFFSPSGYEVKKDTNAADMVCYLPLDTKRNVHRFLSVVRPELAVFVKYEFWPNYLSGLKKRKVPTLLVSGIFRGSQPFFHWYGNFMRKSLRAFDHFFVQDNTSKKLLNKIGIDKVTVSGDTRFDRVVEILERDNRLDFMEAFKQEERCFVAGSTWPEDEKLLVDYINGDAEGKLKYVIAPHTINKVAINKLASSIQKKAILYSEISGKSLKEAQVLIVDTVGLLTKIYSYADIAYVGGGMGTTGLHNTLEPAVFGVPVIIGAHYKGFVEAENLVKLGGIASVGNKKEFTEEVIHLSENENIMHEKGDINKKYIEKSRGAKIQIGHYIRKLLKESLTD